MTFHACGGIPLLWQLSAFVVKFELLALIVSDKVKGV